MALSRPLIQHANTLSTQVRYTTPPCLQLAQNEAQDTPHSVAGEGLRTRRQHKLGLQAKEGEGRRLKQTYKTSGSQQHKLGLQTEG